MIWQVLLLPLGTLAGSLTAQGVRQPGLCPMNTSELKHSHPGASIQCCPRPPTFCSMVGPGPVFSGTCSVPFLHKTSGDRAGSFTEVQQPPRYVIAPEGGSVNITCSTRGALYGIYLMQSWPQNAQVTYYESGRNSTVDKRFRGRIHFLVSQDTLTITVSLLRLTDSGAYTCRASMEMDDAWGSATLVVVTEKLSQGAYRCQKPLLTSVTLPATLAVVFFLTGLGLGVLCMQRKTQIRKLCASREKNLPCVVYEDMSCSRLNASSIPNKYQEPLCPPSSCRA